MIISIFVVIVVVVTVVVTAAIIPFIFAAFKRIIFAFLSLVFSKLFFALNLFSQPGKTSSLSSLVLSHWIHGVYFCRVCVAKVLGKSPGIQVAHCTMVLWRVIQGVPRSAKSRVQASVSAYS